MKRTILFFQAALACLLVGCKQAPESPRLQDEVRYVDPFIGTGFHGHTFPGATRPYAMVQLSPDTHILGWDASSGYHYDDDHIYGFSHTHLSGTGIGDLGDVALLPFSGGDSIKPVATFKKDTEKATPGYYAVRLDNFGINVELTSTDRVGFHKYTYDNPKERRVLLDLGHILQPNWGHKLIGNQYLLVNDSTVEGFKRWDKLKAFVTIATHFFNDVGIIRQRPFAVVWFRSSKPYTVLAGLSCVGIMLMRSPVRRSGELPVIISYYNMTFSRRLACDPKRNISNTLVCACTDFYALNIPTLNLIVDRMRFVG